MNTISTNIANVRADLNYLIEKADSLSDNMDEIYKLSCQLDDLIRQYYQQ